MSDTDPASQGLLAEGTLIGDHFVVRRHLGGGGMGDVYLAEHVALPDIKHAVKVLKRELSGNQRFVTSLFEEANLQSRLDHDNVVQIRDFFAWDGHYCLVQNYIGGATLSTALANAPTGLPVEVALQLICDVLAGLDYAHMQGVLHCDVKPGNVIVDERGRARITDFGIARKMGVSQPGDASLAAGTPAYMSPEQGRPPFQVDHRTDVYSTGAMLFEMLTGRLPFDVPGDGPLPQCFVDPPDVRQFRPELPEIIARIVVTAMARERDRRFGACADFRKEILDYQRRERWRRTWLPAIAIISVVAAAGAFGLWRWSVRAEERAALPIKELIADAATALNLMCRESNERDIRRAGIRLAKEAEDAELLKQFQRRIGEMDANIESYRQRYVNDLETLGTREGRATMRGRELALVAATTPESRRATEAVIADYQASLKGRGPQSTEDLVGHCAAPARTGATGTGIR
jgi:serine/threonine protein kinase